MRAMACLQLLALLRQCLFFAAQARQRFALRLLRVRLGLSHLFCERLQVFDWVWVCAVFECIFGCAFGCIFGCVFGCIFRFLRPCFFANFFGKFCEFFLQLLLLRARRGKAFREDGAPPVEVA